MGTRTHHVGKGARYGWKAVSERVKAPGEGQGPPARGTGSAWTLSSGAGESQTGPHTGEAWGRCLTREGVCGDAARRVLQFTTRALAFGSDVFTPIFLSFQTISRDRQTHTHTEKIPHLTDSSSSVLCLGAVVMFSLLCTVLESWRHLGGLFTPPPPKSDFPLHTPLGSGCPQPSPSFRTHPSGLASS